jgi:acetyl/propionyl-CoA carboxylase alpha subunit
MAARVRVRVGGQEHRVEVRSSVEGPRVVVDGASIAADVSPAGPGTFLLRRHDAAEAFHCVREGRTIHLWWRGSVYRIEEVDDEALAGLKAAAGTLEAPMPGKITAIRAGVGDRVSKGDEVLVVEAMKMENAVRAPRDGVVKGLRVRVGDTVAAGHVLAELE